MATVRQTESRRDEPIVRARRLVADLLVPRPAIYWIDMFVSIVVGYGAATVYLAPRAPAAVQAVAWLVAGCALFRASLFMHEIVHFRRGEMRGFAATWNLLVGIPFLMPSFLYEHHLDHHSARHYGTPRDAEYLPLGTARLGTLLAYLGQILLLPLLATVRFLLLTPVSFLHPRLRRFVLERCSPLVINLRHRRAVPADAPRGLWAAIEIACFLRALHLAACFLVNEVHLGRAVIPLGWQMPVKIYALALLALGLNHVRTLAAHRYRSAGESMGFAGQLDDSLNVVGRTPLAAVLFPVGLRYHALHHLFPAIPYHNLGVAHRRIMEQLPEWEAYRRATYATFPEALRALAAGLREAWRQQPVAADRWFKKRDREFAT